MTEVVNHNPAVIDNTDDLKEGYSGFSGVADNELRMGAEFEEWYGTLTDDERQIVLTDHDTIFAIKKDAEAAIRVAEAARTGRPFELTPTRELHKETTSGVLEKSSSAYRNDDLLGLYAEFGEFLEARVEAARKNGAVLCPTSQIPTTTVQEGLDKILADDRKRSILSNYADVLEDDALRFTFMTSTFQTSLSYRDPEQMYNIVSVANDLAPFLYILGEDTTGFVEDNPRQRLFPPHMFYCKSLGLYGGIEEAYLSAFDADSYLEAHIRQAADMPMFSYFDHSGDVVPADKLHMPTWNSLRAQGLNTGTNFTMAECGTFWPDVKLCDIRDKNEVPIGKRVEIRMVDRGFWMIPLSKMIQDTEGNRQIRDLLEDYGFDGKPGLGSAAVIKQAQFSALRRGHSFLDVSYGAAGNTSAPRTMHDFAKDLSDVVGKYFAGHELEPYLDGFHHICQTGRTNAKVLQEMYPTLDDAKRYVIEAPDEIKLDMVKCLDQHREDGIMPKPQSSQIYDVGAGVNDNGPDRNQDRAAAPGPAM